MFLFQSHPPTLRRKGKRSAAALIACFLTLWSCAEGDLCQGFDEMEYLGPYNATDHARLVGMYFRGIGDQVVYAQSGSCLRYRNCATAEYRSLYGCGAFSSTTGCVERGDGGELGDSSELIFDHCKNDQCILDLSADATKCLLKTWWNDNLDKKANGSCLADPNDSMLTESSFSLFDTSTGWGHCLLALPRGTTLSLQITCHEPGNVPRMRWAFRFPEKLSTRSFSCMLLSRCSNMDDPMDFLCLAGNNSVRTLRDIGLSARAKAQKDTLNLSFSNKAASVLGNRFGRFLGLGIALFVHFWH